MQANSTNSIDGSIKHAPLRRISNGALSDPVSSTNRLKQTIRNNKATSRNLVEFHDSCYSSCSEESHSSLSREPSDGITKEIAQLGLTDVESGSDYWNKLRRNIDFATRLGYSIEQLETVLDKLGADAEQDQILSELLKLGREFMDKGSKLVEMQNSDTVPSAQLRSIVIDGSNIAMTHGRKEVFSCRGIRECVQFFRNRGHTDIIVFVPQFRREAARSDCPITDQHILFELESENVLVWTPSRRINGRRIVCHDDRYILKTAEEKDAVIVSNDEYRDLIKGNPQYRMLVDERLLMYSFVDGRFMPPDDPLGRHGPTLDQFLSRGNQASSSKLCPYARKCTYGNKCKYYHPERPNGIHVSVTERLMNEKQRKQLLSSSMPTEVVSEHAGHPAIARTQSLNISTSEMMKFPHEEKKLTKPSINPPHQGERTHLQYPHSSLPPPGELSVSTIQQATSLLWAHSTLNRHYSAPSNYSSHAVNPRPRLPSAPVIGCNAPTTNTPHCCHSRTAVPPPIYVSYAYGGLPYFTASEQVPDLYCRQPTQYFVPNPNILGDAYGGLQTGPSQQFVSSGATWCKPELSATPLARQSMKPSYPILTNERSRLQSILCQLFPEQAVCATMKAHPDENDPQKLCSLIIMKLQEGSYGT